MISCVNERVIKQKNLAALILNAFKYTVFEFVIIFLNLYSIFFWCSSNPQNYKQTNKANIWGTRLKNNSFLRILPHWPSVKSFASHATKNSHHKWVAPSLWMYVCLILVWIGGSNQVLGLKGLLVGFKVEMNIYFWKELRD